MYPLKVAIDAQIMMKNHARRMVLGAAECAGTAAIVPDAAATMAKLHYHRVEAIYVEKSIVWNTAANNERIDEEALGLRVQDRLEKTTRGFAAWLDNEQQRNDGLFERAPRTRKTQGAVRIDDLEVHSGLQELSDPSVLGRTSPPPAIAHLRTGDESPNLSTRPRRFGTCHESWT